MLIRIAGYSYDTSELRGLARKGAARYHEAPGRGVEAEKILRDALADARRVEAEARADSYNGDLFARIAKMHRERAALAAGYLGELWRTENAPDDGWPDHGIGWALQER